MGIFGPTQAEYDELVACNAGLEADLATEREDTARNLETLQSNRNTIDELEYKLALKSKAGELALYAENVLQQQMESGEIQISAEDTAREVVANRLRDMMVASVADEMLDKVEEDERAQITPATIEETRTELHEVFEHDGTYDDTRQEVRKEARKQIGDALKAQIAEEERTRLAEPAVHAAMVQQARDELERSGQADKIRSEVKDSSAAKFKDEAIAEVKAEAVDQIKEQRPQMVESAKQTYLNTSKGQREVARIKQDLTEEITKRSIDELLTETHDEEWARLVAKKAELEKAELAREILTFEILEGFQNGGIDTRKIPEGAKVELLLGIKGEVNDRSAYYDNNGTRAYGKTASIKRVLTVSALGEGRFLVDHDSLSNDPTVSDIERGIAIADGTEIVLGRKKNSNGNASLHPFISKDVVLYFDDDTTDEPYKISSGFSRVVAVGINGNFTKSDIAQFTLPDQTTINTK